MDKLILIPRNEKVPAQTTFMKKNKVEGFTLLISRLSNKDSMIFVSRLTSKIEAKRKALYRETIILLFCFSKVQRLHSEEKIVSQQMMLEQLDMQLDLDPHLTPYKKLNGLCTYILNLKLLNF